MADANFQNFVDEVIDKNDICDVISEYTKLKRMGNRFAALCPLHNDKKSPSLSVSPDKQLFYCFGCGAGGNVIHFIMAAEHLDFTDALKLLADRARIPVPEFKGGGSSSAKSSVDKKQLIFSINREAGRYFYHNLASESGKEGYEYLKNRGIKNSTIKMFGMGYAPEGWTNLIDYLKGKGFSEHEIYEAGLAKMRDNGTYYDSFYDGRVMIPIINVQGNIIGFGGRIITDRENTGKYLNTPETLVFHKKENLFGLNFAKNDRSGSLLLMEGYMDVISLHQAGITNAVASLGTAFTEEQAKLVKRYGGKAVLCYDSDEAGRKATVRAGEILTAQAIKTKVLTVTDGKDPDEFVRKSGGEMFKVLIERAQPLMEYRINEIQKQYTIETVDENGEKELVFPDSDAMIDFTEAVAGVLSQIKNPVEFEIYLKRAAQIGGISEKSLFARVNNIRLGRERAEEKRAEQQKRRRISREISGTDNVQLYNSEQLMLNLICDRPVFNFVKDKGLTPEDFSTELHSRLAKKIFEMYETDGAVDINRILTLFDESERGMVAKILSDDKNTSDKKKAAEFPLEVIMGNQNLKQQKEMLDNSDLKKLDALIRQRADDKVHHKQK